MCSVVLVMRRGEVVEIADKATLYTNPQHEYTKELLRRYTDHGRRLGRRPSPGKPRLRGAGRESGAGKRDGAGWHYATDTQRRQTD